MRKKLIYNYWLILIAWCLFLNKLTLLAILFGLGACAILATIQRRINYWRMCFVSVISYVLVSLLLIRSNIPYFFSQMYVFLAVICLNVAFTNERLYLFKSRYLKPFLFVMIIGLSVLSTIAFILPNDLYSLFSKISLYIMICLIFLPYLVSLSICLVYKYIMKNLYVENVTNRLVIDSQKI